MTKEQKLKEITDILRRRVPRLIGTNEEPLLSDILAYSKRLVRSKLFDYNEDSICCKGFWDLSKPYLKDQPKVVIHYLYDDVIIELFNPRRCQDSRKCEALLYKRLMEYDY